MQLPQFIITKNPNKPHIIISEAQFLIMVKKPVKKEGFYQFYFTVFPRLPYRWYNRI